MKKPAQKKINLYNQIIKDLEQKQILDGSDPAFDKMQKKTLFQEITGQTENKKFVMFFSDKKNTMVMFYAKKK